MSRHWKPKDPTEVVLREFDWTGFLGEGEAVTATTATVEEAGAPVVDSQSQIDGIQQIKLSGGTVRAVPYMVKLTATTNQGQSPVRRVRIKVRLR